MANLGDVVGYGASPNQAVELVRAMEPISVRGNHDRCLLRAGRHQVFQSCSGRCGQLDARRIERTNLEWLRELPKGPLHDEAWAGVEFVHGSPVDEDTYIHSEYSASAALVACIFASHIFRTYPCARRVCADARLRWRQ